MDFLIARSEGIVSIDNQPLGVDTSALPVNVAIVAYDCSGGAGNIEYSDQLRVLAPFIDITPYVPFANTWLTAASAIVGMPVTLAQAKRVKIGLVDGIFNSKRQLPINYVGNTWDATDQSMIGMQTMINAWSVETDITTADAILADNMQKLQVLIHQTGNASQPAAYASGTGSIDAAVRFDKHLSGGVWDGTYVRIPGTSPTWVTSVGGGGVNAQPTYVPIPAGQIGYQTTTGPSVSWTPLNATAPVSLSMTSMRTLISNIQTRRGSLQSTRLTKTNAINLLTTVAAVIAYDVTTGWPS
jgi:hypothetical protein